MKAKLFARYMLSGLAFGAFFSRSIAAVTVSVDPTTQIVATGSNVIVDIDISGVTDLYGFQFDLTFNPAVLSAVSSSEGSFLPSGGSTYFIPGTNDNVGGTVTATADTLLTAISGTSGSGPLASFDFKALGSGTSPFAVSNLILLDSNFNSINSAITGGTVTVSAVPEPSDFVFVVTGVFGLMFFNRRCKREQKGSADLVAC